MSSVVPLLKVSTPAIEGSLHVSKLLKLPVLFDVEELAALFKEIEREFQNFYIFPVAEIVPKGQEVISKEEFLAKYALYLKCLKTGEVPDPRLFRTFFSSVLTLTPESVYVIDINGISSLIKPIHPIVQMQTHHFAYSSQDQTLRSMVFSKESISWGLHFSYPQLFQHPKTQEIGKVLQEEGYPNTPLFKKIQKWVRVNTMATPLKIEGNLMNATFRIGKKCFAWIDNHPQLKEIKVTQSKLIDY